MIDERPDLRETPVHSQGGMDYLVTRQRRFILVYAPLGIFALVLLFPFYWMTITTFKSNDEIYDYEKSSPFWVVNPTLANIKKLLFDTSYPEWLLNTMLIAGSATFLALFASVLAAYAIERLRFQGSRWVGLGIYAAYLVPPSILFIPLATMVFSLGLFDTRWALILKNTSRLGPCVASARVVSGARYTKPGSST